MELQGSYLLQFFLASTLSCGTSEIGTGIHDTNSIEESCNLILALLPGKSFMFDRSLDNANFSGTGEHGAIRDVA